MSQGPLFKTGDAILLRSTKELGVVEGEPDLDGGEYWYRVRFTKRTDQVVEEFLEVLADPGETLESLTRRGAWGKLQAFRSALTVERLTHTDQSTLYAFRGQRVLFEAFQYKPLLKVLESPDRRILIADEVGLGKTIEAGLILTELEARKRLERVLVVCPSRLREKWRAELIRKFDMDFTIAARADLEEYLERVRLSLGRGRLRAVVSMQTLRNPELREEFLAEVGEIDLLIVDEAHHARNPSAQTSEMLRDLCEVAGAVLLLTATPLHLGNRDLFTLLQALRPAEFRDYEVFDQRLRRHSAVHDAAALVRSRRAEHLPRTRRLLSDLFVDGVSDEARDPLAVQVVEDLSAPPPDVRGWVELERRVQDLHPLASVLTRTRKRDVNEVTAVRSAKVVRCEWTDEEDEAYRRLVHGSGRLGWIDRPIGFGQIQRARQAASCLPAALAAARERARTEDEEVEWADILRSDLGNLGPDDPPAEPPPDPGEWDSKFEKLIEVLCLIQAEEPGAKVLIFTFFVGTSRYLERRLTEAGFPAVRIAGDVRSDPKRPDQDDRGRAMNRFEHEPGVQVLVSTEVGSEGLDFQFCHCLVNYDLPWNPMVVEQRIGRIDRFGQKADKLHIFNLVVEGTVEDRILHRLYERIGIFGEGIGQLEAILGEEVSALQQEYVSGRLTPAEAEARVDQAVRAIQARRSHLEELERNASNLFGHEEYLKDQLRRVGRLGRYITERSMLAVIEAYLQDRHPAVRIWEEPVGEFHLRLTDDLRREIQDASPRDDVWIDRSRKSVYSFCFDGERAYGRPELDLINVSHPFLRAAKEAVRVRLDTAHARIARVTLALTPGEDADLKPGRYFVVVFAQVVEGIRPRRFLETVAWSVSQATTVPAEVAERLLHLVQDAGVEWDPAAPAPPMPADVWSRVVSEARGRNRRLDESERRENAALYVRRKALLEAEFAHDRAVKSARLRTAEERGRSRVIPALQGQLVKAESVFRSRLADLDKTRDVSCRLSDPLATCLVEVL
jgi:SNF2 family DNA or RNA helicase